MATIVMSRAGLILAGWSRVWRWLVWVVVAFMAGSLVLNVITPSAGERAIWVPILLVLLTSSAVVAIKGFVGTLRLIDLTASKQSNELIKLAPGTMLTAY